MNLKNLKRTYQMLVQDPFKKWKETSKGAYFIKKAYILAPNNWADPKVWFGGHICYCIDVEEYVHNNVLEDYGKDEADRFYQDDETFETYCRKYAEEIQNYIRETGKRITLQHAWEKSYF